MTWNFLHNLPKRALIEVLIKLSEGTMRLEINEANSTELLKINEATIAVNGLEIIVKELSKVPKYNEVIKENWVTTVKDIKEETPDSWIKWELRSHSEKGWLIVKSLRDLVSYVVDLSDVPKCGSFNPYGNEQMAENPSRFILSSHPHLEGFIGATIGTTEYFKKKSTILSDFFPGIFKFVNMKTGNYWPDMTITMEDALANGFGIQIGMDVDQPVKDEPAKVFFDQTLSLPTRLGLIWEHSCRLSALIQNSIFSVGQ